MKKLFLKISNIIVVTILIIIISIITVKINGQVNAQETKDEILSVLVNTLNRELHEVYEPYVKFVEEIEKTENTTSLYSIFSQNIDTWKAVFEDSSYQYKKYINNSDKGISDISQLALDGAIKGIKACEAYNLGLNSDNKEDLSLYFNQGDALIKEAETSHDKAVNYYNSYSGVSDSIATRDLLIVFTVLSSLFSLFLFFKSRNKSLLEPEIKKSQIYKNLFASSLWMTGGLIVTTGGYSYALQKGGSYYILYGPILIGGWQLLKGLVDYFKNGRPILNKLSREIKSNAIKESYIQNTNILSKPVREKTCHGCGAIQSNRSIVCNKCGENIL